MHRLFTRDIIIAVLLSIIIALQFQEYSLIVIFPFPVLLIVFWFEELEEKILRGKKLRKKIKKLIKRKALPPTKARQS